MTGNATEPGVNGGSLPNPGRSDMQSWAHQWQSRHKHQQQGDKDRAHDRRDLGVPRPGARDVVRGGGDAQRAARESTLSARNPTRIRTGRHMPTHYMPHHRIISPAKLGCLEYPHTPLSLIAPLLLPTPCFQLNFCWSANTSRRNPNAHRMMPMMSCVNPAARQEAVKGGTCGWVRVAAYGGRPECNVGAAEAGARRVGRVEDRDGEGDGPGPHHLEHEEPAERDELALRRRGARSALVSRLHTSASSSSHSRRRCSRACHRSARPCLQALQSRSVTFLS